MTKQAKVKACPFCGKQPKVRTDIGWWIECERHKDLSVWAWSQYRSVAIRRWNRRVSAKKKT